MEKLFSRMFFNRIDLPRSLFAFWKKKADANCVYYRSEMNPQFKIARFPICNSTNNLLRQSLNTSWSTLQRLTQFFLNLIDLLRSFSKISEEKQLILTASFTADPEPHYDVTRFLIFDQNYMQYNSTKSETNLNQPSVSFISEHFFHKSKNWNATRLFIDFEGNSW